MNADHGLRASQWEMAIFDPPTESTTLNQSPKNWRPYSCAKFDAHPPLGLLGEWVKYNLNYFYLCPFWELT